MTKYIILNSLGEGSYAKVFKCKNIADGSIWACKQLFKTFKSIDEIERIPEIQVLKKLSEHANIIKLHEIIYNNRICSLCLIFEWMDMDLYVYIKDRKSPLPKIIVAKCIYSILIALEYIHRHGFIHRDGEHFKLADFGMCRSVSNGRPLTDYVATRWYRAPECILTEGYYGQPMDIWSMGCVMFEIITLKPLFVSTNDIDLINKIHSVFGTPSMKILKKFEQHKNRSINFNFQTQQGIGLIQDLAFCSLDTVDLLIQMLFYDDEYRITASNALFHSYFDHFQKKKIFSKSPIENNNDSILIKNDIAIIETNFDKFITKQLSTIKEELSSSNLSKSNKDLLLELSIYFNQIEQLLILIHTIDIFELINLLNIDSISNLRRIFQFVSILMKKLHLILESILLDLNTNLKIILKISTWRIKSQLLIKFLKYLKSNGFHCLTFINQLKKKFYYLKKQIRQIISNLRNRLSLENIKRNQFIMKNVFKYLSPVVIYMFIKIIEIIVLDNKILFVTNEKLNKTNMKFIYPKNETEEIIKFLLVIEDQTEKVISLVSIIEFDFKLHFYSKIDILIEQIEIIDSNTITILQQKFFMELLKLKLNSIYDKLSIVCIMFSFYIDISDKFIIDKSNNIQSIESDDKQKIENNNLVKQYSIKMNIIRTQITQLIQQEKMKYLTIYKKRQDEFNQILNDF
ncbi:unnamed protein product [Rotaria magnacalcarata]|uniref:Protein kinase domain-containing protein n=1 Tax=Rotaria magnacalcarata TaxID=392030 RepID=A0A817A6I7_9BILA|nr:unnamed protein product [Rotaria magnacalcarata]